VPDGVVEAVEKLKQRAPEAAPLSEVEKREAEAHSKLKAQKAPGPSVKPLAMAFFMSELVASCKFSTADMARKFCEYVSSSCGGLEVELWVGASASELVFAAASSKTVAEAGGALRELAEKVPADGPGAIFGEAAVSAVRDAGGVMRGSLVVSGTGAAGVSPDYLAAVGSFCVGVLLSWGQDLAAPKAA
jgi:hypothetical protein